MTEITMQNKKRVSCRIISVQGREIVGYTQKVPNRQIRLGIFPDHRRALDVFADLIQTIWNNENKYIIPDE